MRKMIPLIAAAIAITAFSASNSNGQTSSSNICSSKHFVDWKPTAEAMQETFSVFFASDNALLTSEGHQIISQAAKRFGHSDGASIFVISSDRDGSNQALPKERLAAVKQALADEGISPSLVHVRWSSRGEEMPLSLRKWQDRRVLITVEPSTSSPLSALD